MFVFQRNAFTMPLFAIAIGVCLLQPICVLAVQQNVNPGAESVTADRSQGNQATQYLITVSQYPLKGVDVSAMTADEILAAIKRKNVVPFETVMLSAIEGAASRASFGREVTVTTGFVIKRDGKSRNTKHVNLGTILAVTPTTEGHQG